MKKSFGNLIKETRIKNGFSQQELSEHTTYSRDYLSKIEVGKRNPSDDFLVSISTTLNFDFSTLYKKLNNFRSLDDYFFTNKLVEYIETKDIDRIKQMLENEITAYKMNYGEPRMTKEYCQALIIFYIDSNIDKTLHYCLDILEITYDKLDDYEIKVSSPYYYSLLLLLGHIMSEKNDYDMLENFLKKFLTFIDNYYLNDILPIYSVEYYYKKLYITILNNYADTLLKLGECQLALNQCDKAIDMSNKLNILSLLPYLYKMKVEILYVTGNSLEAKQNLNYFQCICDITNNNKYYDNIINYFKKQFNNFV